MTPPQMNVSWIVESNPKVESSTKTQIREYNYYEQADQFIFSHGKRMAAALTSTF